MTTTIEQRGDRLSHRQIQIVFLGLMLGMLLAALDQTIVSTALPTIVGDLGGLTHLSWVVTAYLLASTASTPLYGKLGDLYGRKIIFQAAIVIFLAGSALSGLSQNMNELIAFRALQGLGAGGLMASALAIIGDVVAPRERGRYQGYMGGVFAFASVAGPLTGGFFTDHLSWRWVFYINLPIGALALVVTSIVLDLPFRRVQRRIDWLGAGLIVAAVTSILLVTVWGGDQYAWGSPQILGLAAAGLVLLALFILQERRAEEPILPPHLFANGIFRVSLLLMFLVAIGLFGALVYLPVFLQLATGASATNSGLLLLPLMAGLLCTSIASGQLITRTGHYKWSPLTGTFIMTIGLFLLSRMTIDTTRLTSGLYMLVLGFGLGGLMQVSVLATQNAVDRRDLGTATSAIGFFRNLGGAVGVAGFGAVFTNRLAHYLPQHLPASALGRFNVKALQGSPSTIHQLPPVLRDGIAQSFAQAIHVVYLVAVPVAALSFVVALFLKELPLRERANIGTNAEAQAPAQAIPVPGTGGDGDEGQGSAPSFEHASAPD
ncbi:MAG TPA: MDR family MFS transporter [Actinomycetota bacterium]